MPLAHELVEHGVGGELGVEDQQSRVACPQTRRQYSAKASTSLACSALVRSALA